MTYFCCSISWHHKPFRLKSHAAFLASFACAFCYFGVLLKGWCCGCTCESKTDRRGVLCQYEMPKQGLHFKFIFSRKKLTFFIRLLGLSGVSKWHLMTALLGRAGFWESFRCWSALSPFIPFPSILSSVLHCSWDWPSLSHVLIQYP